MATKVTWHGPAVEKAFDQRVSRGLGTAGKGLEGDIRAALGHGGGDEGSSGGQPPRRRSGALQGAVGVEASGGGRSVRVGNTDRSQIPKAVRLARGFTGTDSRGARRDDPPRPFVGPAVAKRKGQIVSDVANGR